MIDRIEIHADDLWAQAVAGMLETVPDGSRMCLPAGRTVDPAYRLVESLRAEQLFLLDEYGGLSPDDPARCLNMVRAGLLDGLDHPPPLLAPDVDAADAETAAVDYGRIISDGGLDLAVLGLGANGHLGMNEPGSTPRETTRVVTLAKSTSETALTYGSKSLPKWGITIGLRELLAAAEIWLLVTGARKSAILRDTITGPVGPRVPATYLQDHPNVRVVADASAAKAIAG